MELPFHNVDNNDLYFISNGKPIWKNLPSFSIQSLINEMPGYKNDDYDFLHNTITSNYYCPSDFLTTNFSKNGFSIFHLNIASLSIHIVELRILLSILEHFSDIIGINETRTCTDNSIINLEINGYKFYHIKTPTKCEGVGVYIKSLMN